MGPTGATRVAPVYTVTGAVTDGASGFGGGSGLSLPVKVQATDAAHVGRSTTTNSSGGYRMEGIDGGNLTLTVSAYGYETTTKTVNVTGDTRVDFALPRIAQSGTPNVAGFWGAQMYSGYVTFAEFTLAQDGSSVSGTWRVPSRGTAPEWRGTISGTITSDRSLIGGMTMNTPCTASGPLIWGLLDYSERFLTLTVRLAPSSGACPSGVTDYNTFFLDRTCRITSSPGLACDPITPQASVDAFWNQKRSPTRPATPPPVS
jgi:Carboxypeptidase regulatory-like domain